MQYKSVVIGLGNIGLKYDIDKKNEIKTHTKAFLSHNKTDLIAGIDNNEENRKLFTSKTNIKAYSNLDAIENVDIIAISVPTKLHLEFLKQCINKKPKLIILEKPVVQNYSDLQEIKKNLKNNSIPILVNYIRRFDPSTYNIKEMFLKKELGKFLSGEVTYNRGLFNTATHFIDFLAFLFDSEYKIESSSKFKKISEVENDYELDFKINFNTNSCTFKSLTDHKGQDFSQKYFFEKGLLEISPGPKIQLNGKSLNHQFDQYQLNALNHAIDFLEGKTELISDINSGLKSCEPFIELIRSLS